MIAQAPSVKQEIVSVRFDLLDYAQVFAIIQEWRKKGHNKYISITNPHSVLLCRRDEAMWNATRGAGLTLPDGVGIPIAAGILGYAHNGRVTGPTLMLNVCDWARRYGYRHYFYGGADGVADTLAERLCGKFPGLDVAGTYCPPFRELTAEEDEEIIHRINSARPDIVWVGLGAPQQEKWMAAHVGRIDAAAMIGVGAAFDFHSGNVKWTPAWIRRMGIEWAYRLAQNPKRMWRRNLDSPKFLMAVLWQGVTRRFRRTERTNTNA